MDSMDTLNLYHELERLLRMDSRYCMDDGTLLKNRIVEDALAVHPLLIKYLLGNEKMKQVFFREVEGVMVFDKVKFQRFVSDTQFLGGSYTMFKNKIGLTNDNGRFISESREVVLSWPYKDCMLEGGQTKEEAKRNEVFWNETLAPDEVNRLTEPKAFSNFKRYDKDGEHPVEHLAPTDNLIIKGNNLLALHSLKRKYSGKVKLILIDPPYYFAKTKSADTFCYNSNFHLSTWLTFMRDRLLAAKDLLSNDGVILCHIKEDGFHWLKVLMEEIYKQENFVETFVWKNTDNPDALSNKSRASIEYVICFEKSKDSSRAYIGKETENGDAPLLNTGNSVHELSFPIGTIHFKIPDGIYPKGKPDRVELINDIIVKDSLNANEVVLRGEFKWGADMLFEELKNGTYFLVKSNKFSIRFQRKEGTTMAPEKFIEEQYLSKAIGVGTNEDASTHLKKMGINFSNSKPESIVAFFLRAITKESDLVLDFFLGSGTTCAVAHKMKRRYIGIEQMNYIQTETLKRMLKVIDGEQGGVSKSVSWQGGGSFVYCELAKANGKFVEEIEAATTTEQLENIWSRMKATGHLNYKVDIKEVDANAADFEALTIEDQKRFLIECLDKNLLYVPLADIDSNEYDVSDEDKRLTREFYKGGSIN